MNEESPKQNDKEGQQTDQSITSIDSTQAPNESTTNPQNANNRSISLQSPKSGDSLTLPPIELVPRPDSQLATTENSENAEIENPMTIQPPIATFSIDSSRQQIGIRCVCKEGHTDCLLVRCSICGYYVHGKCVGVARVLPKMKYVCPYCKGHSLRCNCLNNEKYDEPIIKCTKCHYWVHKSCAGFTFGPNPANFLCYACGLPTYHLPKPFFSERSQCKEHTASIDFDRSTFISKLPTGEFRDMIEDDLKMSEFNFRETMIRYVDEFSPCLFDYSHEFWKVFASTLSEILKCEKSDILEAIDELVVNILYRPMPKKHKSTIPGLVISDSILPDIDSVSIPKIEAFPEPVKIYITKDFTVCTETSIENYGFICDIPGLLCHEDEIDANEGIPRTCINIPNTRIFIDVSRSTNTVVQYIRRSFNFNCVIKLHRIKGEVHVGLFAIRTKGPLAEEKMCKTAAIPKDGELFLPLDADLPYSVMKPIWKEKKVKPKPPPKPKKQKQEHKHDHKIEYNKQDQKLDHKQESRQTKDSHTKRKKSTQFETRSMKTRARAEFPINLTLLSAFLEDACPPMPIIIKDQREIEEENPDPTSIRARLRHPAHHRHANE
ncbi:PHD-finger family protein [Tritrichomonas foetus]|uniref:PHD-finger family protein n=1 Tax=Tritrichomonas foetus TaxID=1144522 RepID=A0A1J4KQ25_9EUKA|nr:PHD-finger family protein [Tritrichomonas foetus]|eukprot:OHT11892.1 PHD-finger family protein [Tritrichomonas foetus]